MKKILRNVMLTLGACSLLAGPITASPFGLFTTSCCSTCGICVRPYNAFTPICICGGEPCGGGYGCCGYAWGSPYGGMGMGTWPVPDGYEDGGCVGGNCGKHAWKHRHHSKSSVDGYFDGAIVDGGTYEGGIVDGGTGPGPVAEGVPSKPLPSGPAKPTQAELIPTHPTATTAPRFLPPTGSPGAPKGPAYGQPLSYGYNPYSGYGYGYYYGYGNQAMPSNYPPAWYGQQPMAWGYPGMMNPHAGQPNAAPGAMPNYPGQGYQNSLPQPVGYYGSPSGQQNWAVPAYWSNFGSR